MRFFLSFFVFLAAAFTLTGAEPPLSANDFLAQVRHPTGQQNYAKLAGEIRHRRSGASTQTSSIYLGILMVQNQRNSQLIINNAEEYRIGQSYTSGDQGSTVTPGRAEGYPDSVLNDYGVKPQDLTMSFLYWKQEKEEKKRTIRTVDCRVFLLCDQKSGEVARVYISEKYFFPIKVEFYADLGSLATPIRTMEVESFEQTENDFWVPTELKLYGKKDDKSWRTVVEFTQVEAAAYDPAAPPSNLFREL